MVTMTQPTKIRKRNNPTPVHGSCRWLGDTPTALDLDAGEALLRIATDKGIEALYFVERLDDGKGNVVGYRLTKKDNGAVYDLDATFGGGVLICDCPDATYVDRPGGCKHSRGLSTALKSANLL